MSGARNGVIYKPMPTAKGRADGLGEEVFSSGQVARLCRVAPRTVSKWFDSGKLRGYRIPGSNDRRFPKADLVRFLVEVGMPVPPEFGDLVPRLRFPPVGLFLPRVVAGVAVVGAVGAGVLAARGRLEVAVIGCEQGYATAECVGAELRAACSDLRLAVWLPEDRGGVASDLWSHSFPWDADPGAVAAWAERG